MKSYLVQRCTTKPFTQKQFNSIDEMLDYDYMGSSEYEWEALPALKMQTKIYQEGIKKGICNVYMSICE